jgi:hypothetical protein
MTALQEVYDIIAFKQQWEQDHGTTTAASVAELYVKHVKFCGDADAEDKGDHMSETKVV